MRIIRRAKQHLIASEGLNSTRLVLENRKQKNNYTDRPIYEALHHDQAYRPVHVGLYLREYTIELRNIGLETYSS